MAQELEELPKFHDLVSQRLQELEDFLITEHTKRVKVLRETVIKRITTGDAAGKTSLRLSVPEHERRNGSTNSCGSIRSSDVGDDDQMVNSITTNASSDDDEMETKTSNVSSHHLGKLNVYAVQAVHSQASNIPLSLQPSNQTHGTGKLFNTVRGWQEDRKASNVSLFSNHTAVGFQADRKASNASLFSHHSVQADSLPHQPHRNLGKRKPQSQPMSRQESTASYQHGPTPAMSAQTSAASHQTTGTGSSRAIFNVVNAKMKQHNWRKGGSILGGMWGHESPSPPSGPPPSKTEKVSIEAPVQEEIEELLSDEDGHHLRVLPAWESCKKTRRTNGLSGATRITEMSIMSRISSEETVSIDDLQAQSSLWEAFVIHPESKKRYLWEIFSLLFVTWDLVNIPLKLLYLPQTQTSLNMSWAGRIFWTLDMLLHFFLGYAKHDGSPELRCCRVVRHYLKTKFLIDFLVLSTEWVEMSQIQALKELQVLQSLRLLRLTRMQVIIELLMDYFDSERWVFIISLSRSIAAIVSITHVAACLWIGVGRHDSGWVDQYDFEAKDAVYLISFHWALTQLTGTMEVNPTTVLERLFAICCLLMGFIIGTAFVSTITSSLTRLMITENQQASQERCLSKFLHEQGVSRKLTHRVQLNARHMLEEQHRFTAEADVDLLQTISESLLVELHFEIHSSRMKPHPLLRHIARETAALMRQICHTCMDNVPILENDVLFSPGEVPFEPQVIFICAGNLAYTQDRIDYVTATVNEWACEQVLWTHWVYRGELSASTKSRLAIMSAEMFTEVVKKSSLWHGLDLCTYAKNYVQLLSDDDAACSELGSAMDYDELMAMTFPHLREQSSTEHGNGHWWHIHKNSGRNSGGKHNRISGETPSVSRQSSVTTGVVPPI